MLQNREEQGRDSGAGEEMRRIFGFSVLFVSLSKYAKMLLGHMVCYLSSPSANVLGFWHTQRVHKHMEGN